MTREEAYRLAIRACEVTWNAYICKQINEALEQKTGHWIDTDPDDACFYMCSKCHGRADIKFDYCPICGAKMVEPHKSEDKEVQQKKYDCCRDCKYLSNTKSSIGYLCEHPAKHFRTEISCWKPKATKACKQFERGVYNG